jgi:RNA polymerase sigma-B factor
VDIELVELDLPDQPDEREQIRIRLREFATLAADSPRRVELREDLLRVHMPIVEYVARRFNGRGEPLADLVQVGCIGLINALDRFEPERGLEFTSYATPTIVGEIKRYFRDKGWMVRVPRRLQEVRTSMAVTVSELSQKLGRAPTITELSGALSATEEEIVEAMESGNAYSPMSIEAQTDAESGWSLADTLGGPDSAMEHVEHRESLKPLLAGLDERERTILMMRFFQNRTQSQIALAVGVSQMHVSRLLARTLAEMREKLLDEG